MKTKSKDPITPRVDLALDVAQQAVNRVSTEVKRDGARFSDGQRRALDWVEMAAYALDGVRRGGPCHLYKHEAAHAVLAALAAESAGHFDDACRLWTEVQRVAGLRVGVCLGKKREAKKAEKG